MSRVLSFRLNLDTGRVKLDTERRTYRALTPDQIDALDRCVDGLIDAVAKEPQLVALLPGGAK